MRNWKNWLIIKKVRQIFCKHKMWGVKIKEDYLEYTCLHCDFKKNQKRP